MLFQALGGVKSISVGGYHSCALMFSGQLKCWGTNTFGQLGLGSTTSMGDALNRTGDSLAFVSLGTNRTAKQVTTALQHSCALLDNNLVSQNTVAQC
jgi:alpha-tubulin suppressor-like RCC1 family protein